VEEKSHHTKQALKPRGVGCLSAVFPLRSVASNTMTNITSLIRVSLNSLTRISHMDVRVILYCAHTHKFSLYFHLVPACSLELRLSLQEFDNSIGALESKAHSRHGRVGGILSGDDVATSEKKIFITPNLRVFVDNRSLLVISRASCSLWQNTVSRISLLAIRRPTHMCEADPGGRYLGSAPGSHPPSLRATSIILSIRQFNHSPNVN
jgi:hypothetical protein